MISRKMEFAGRIALKLSFYVRVFERKYSFFSRSPEFFCLTVSLSGFSSVILNPS